MGTWRCFHERLQLGTCLEGSVVKISPDIPRAKSLRETALGRVSFLENQPLREASANYIFEGYYASLLETMHALVAVNGYRVSNHLCLGFYLRDLLKETKLFQQFDRCRARRHALVYYGKHMDLQTALSAIKECKEAMGKINGLLDSALGKARR